MELSTEFDGVLECGNDPGSKNASLSSSSNSTVKGLAFESRVVLITIYTVAAVLSVVGNVLVIAVFSVGKRSKSDLRGYLINLAVADLVMAVFCMPFTFTMTMLGHWIFSEPMCPVVLYMQTVSVTASVGTNMAIGIDRFYVVRYPLRSRVVRSRSKFVIGAVWLVSLTSSSIQLAVGKAQRREDNDGGSAAAAAAEETVVDCNEVWPHPNIVWRRVYTLFIFVFTYVIPLAILAGTYGVLGLRLWRRTVPGNADVTRDKQQIKSKRKVIKMLVTVVVLFAVCWLPLHVFMFIVDFRHELIPNGTVLMAAYHTVHWLAMSNSFVNPIVYSFLNETFRLDLLDVLQRCSPSCVCLLRPRVISSRDPETQNARPSQSSSARNSGATCSRTPDSSRSLAALNSSAAANRCDVT